MGRVETFQINTFERKLYVRMCCRSEQFPNLVGMRAKSWARLLRSRALLRLARRRIRAGRGERGLALIRRALLTSPRPPPSACLLAAQLLREQGASALEVRAAQGLYECCVRAGESAAGVKASEGLALLACQQGDEGYASDLL